MIDMDRSSTHAWDVYINLTLNATEHVQFCIICDDADLHQFLVTEEMQFSCPFQNIALLLPVWTQSGPQPLPEILSPHE